jgi:hypothetical protein
VYVTKCKVTRKRANIGLLVWAAASISTAVRAPAVVAIRTRTTAVGLGGRRCSRLGMISVVEVEGFLVSGKSDEGDTEPSRDGWGRAYTRPVNIRLAS